MPADPARSSRGVSIETARTEWCQAYSAAKGTVEAVLRFNGRRDLMPRVFHDLAVPSNAKVTAPPVEATAPGQAPN